jgi:hypothetical protein
MLFWTILIIVALSIVGMFVFSKLDSFIGVVTSGTRSSG